jgi:hypothetical protein
VIVRKMGVCAITDVEFNTKELKRIMNWHSFMAKKTKPIEADAKLFRKIEVMYDAEKEFEESLENDE